MLAALDRTTENNIRYRIIDDTCHVYFNLSTFFLLLQTMSVEYHDQVGNGTQNEVIDFMRNKGYDLRSIIGANSLIFTKKGFNNDVLV